MPLDRLVLMLVVVVATAGATIFMVAFIAVALTAPLLALPALILISLVGYVIWRVVADRIRSREDDHYDNIDK